VFSAKVVINSGIVIQWLTRIIVVLITSPLYNWMSCIVWRALILGIKMGLSRNLLQSGNCPGLAEITTYTKQTCSLPFPGIKPRLTISHFLSHIGPQSQYKSPLPYTYQGFLHPVSVECTNAIVSTQNAFQSPLGQPMPLTSSEPSLISILFPPRHVEFLI
jgi:hypothetical protein